MAVPSKKVSKLFIEQEGVMHSISNVVTHLKTRKSSSALLLRERLNLLNLNWEKCRQLDVALQSAQTQEDKELPYFKDNLFQDIEDVYEKTVDYILERIPCEPSTSLHDSSVLQHSTRLQKPQLTLPSFSGNYSEWLYFRDLFTSLVINDKSLDNIERLHYLVTCLSGEASIIVKDLALTGDNFNAAWSNLKDRYDNNLFIIENCMTKLRELPEVTSDFLKGLKNLRDTTISALTTLKALKRPVDKWDDWLVTLLASRFDKQSRREWETLIGSSTDMPTYDKIESFLQTRIRTLEALENCSKPIENKFTKNPVKQNKSSSVHVHQISKKYSCPVCNNEHKIYTCKKFQDMSLTDRENFITQTLRCTNCLAKNDSVTNCISKFNCKVCKERHHYLLDNDNDKHSNNAAQLNSSVQEQSMSRVNSHLNSNSKIVSPVLLATARVIIKSNDGRQICVRALLDQGSEASFVSESVVQTLRLPRLCVSTSISGLGGKHVGKASNFVEFLIKSTMSSETELKARALVIPKITNYVPKQFAMSQDLSHLHNLKLADPSYMIGERIDLLIGSDLYGTTLRNGVKHGPLGTPTAQLTMFGWILSGPCYTEQGHSTSIQIHHAFQPSLKESLLKFWAIEEVPESVPLSKLEQECECQFQTSHYRLPDGRFCVRLPFRSSPLELKDSRSNALSSFFRLEKKLKRNSELNEIYIDFLEKYKSLGHMTQLNSEQMTDPTRIFIPHLPVLRDSSMTTKLRVVFNASSTSSQGKSLNNILHIGPKLQSDLTAIILRWRARRYVMSTDIAKMFRQIVVDPEDRKFQCIFWRNDPTEPLEAYELNTVTYGTSSAPYLANRVIKQLAVDGEIDYPLAASTLKCDTYVDDIFFGAEDLNLAKQTRDQLVQLTSTAGLQLRKWSSNSQELLSDIDSSDHDLALELPFDTASELKILGITWCPNSDEFKFKVIPLSDNIPTKRLLFSSIAKLFDPHGWLAPVIIKAKILIQSLWLMKLSWDETLPPDVVRSWKTFRSELDSITQITIPRWLKLCKDLSRFKLHGFSDSSKSAYAAVVYSRVVTHTGDIHVNLVTAKTKVAPLKTLSIARLELCGAALLAKLMIFVQNSLRVPNTELFCWTDSTIFLCWLRKQPSSWNVFVANRVANIQTILPQASWRHVSTKDNPADCASRGVSAIDLQNHPLWWKGPKWLSTAEENWPKEKFSSSKDDLEMRVTVNTHIVSESWDLLSRYSSWSRLLRVTAYILRFVNALRKIHIRSVHLSAAEINAASDFWKNLPSNSKLKKLNPILDDQNILRIGGRIKHSNLSFQQKFPVILPKCQLAELIVRQMHRNLLHSGTQLTLVILREKFWIMGARSLVKSTIHDCVVCTRSRAKTESQLMADLPTARCSPSRAFLHSGVDYAGPILIRTSSGRGHKSHKAYIAIFVCFSTRAIHLELVNDYSTNAFLAAFKRFVSRRGIPSDFYSDNGTNFHGAERELKKALETLNKNVDLVSQIATDGTNWHFSPPSAPHFGGLWEAGVKSIKSHLRKVLGAATPTYEELITLLIQVEACVNLRPIAPLNDDVESFETLTPGHFLIGTSLKSVPTPSLLTVEDSRLSRWQTYTKMLETFWRNWKRDYIHSLQQRDKWNSQRPNLRENDLVILKNENLPPAM